ncbi:autotransporter domain-containing protein [Qipengyuania nanhaisediminis]|uniref:autotransporter domain-containing protein n=1 Tax=Qipengyuania nanhaisediminis TaxID=604088 RepID=UPI0038B2D14D
MSHRIHRTGAAMAAIAAVLAAAPALAQSDSERAETEESSANGRPAALSSYRLRSADAEPDARPSSWPGPDHLSRSARRPVGDAQPAPIGNSGAVATSRILAGFTGSVQSTLPRDIGNLVNTIAQPEPRIIARDDVGLGGTIDIADTQPSVVQLLRQDNVTGAIFFNCTGTLINPRTVLTAAHCVNSVSSENYGLPGAAPSAILVATGPDASVRFGNYLAGENYAQGGVATSTDVIVHPSSDPDNGALEFPWADIALVALDQPITDIPAMPILLTPLSELTHVVQVGYGRFGTANGDAGGGVVGIGFLRRVGENMLGAIASPADLADSLFPGFAPTRDLGFETQNYYFTDFDNPDRTQDEIDGCAFSANGISCADLAAVRAIDYFDGDALPGEVATSGGDSGSPLIVDQLYDFPVVTAVLSGGFDFFGVPEGFGDISFYNPLYPFFEFLTENTPYKYVSALEGDGLWSDPSRWTQRLDPGFFVDDGTGTLVNGIPVGPEPGVFATGPNLGTILGTDIAGYSPANSPFLPSEGTPGFGGNLPASSVLLGPGSTGFVPLNTNGTPGTAFVDPARYFEVILNRRGTTTVDLDVEIDRLVIDHRRAGLIVPTQHSFTSVIGIEQLRGTATIHGIVSTPIYTLGNGELRGSGTIDVDVLFNLNGLLSAGGAGRFATLAIEGDYVQASAGGLWADFSLGRRRVVTHDFYDIAGAAVLDGNLVLATSSRRVRFGSQFAVLSADVIDGDFASTVLLSPSAILDAEHRIEGNEVIVTITARSIRDLVGSSSSLGSLGGALDRLRARRHDRFAALFDRVDSASIETLGATLMSLAPVSAFGQAVTSNALARRFSRQIGRRLIDLRSGRGTTSAFATAGPRGHAIASTGANVPSQIGMFASISGSYLGSTDTLAQRHDVASQLTFQRGGEAVVGADFALDERLSLGLAIAAIRSPRGATGADAVAAERSTALALYAGYDAAGWLVDAYAGTGDQRLGSQRRASGEFALAYDQALGRARARQTFGGIRVGRGFALASGVEAGPVVSLDYQRADIGSFEETGAGEFGLVVGRRSVTSLGVRIGAMASAVFETGAGSRLRAFGSFAHASELGDSKDVVTAHFSGAEDTPFAIENPLASRWLALNAGAEWSSGDHWHASLVLTADTGRGPLSHREARVTFSWQF